MNFNKKYRLSSKQDFQFVFDQPRKITRGALLLLYRPNSLPHPRLGIITTKRYVKNAVNRNWLRRRVRESYRHHKDRLQGIDIIVLMRSEWSSVDRSSLRDDIDKLWQQLAKA